MRVFLRTVILFVSTLAVTNGQQANAHDHCESQETCTACIRSPNCVWCDKVVDDVTMKAFVRCINRQDLVQTNQWCSGGTIVDETSTTYIIKNDPVSSNKYRKQVQIQPQIVSLKLRRGEEQHVKVLYKQAEDYPVDLYFLVDLSRSMKSFRDNLSLLGDRLVQAMKNLTANVQLGFGSFVDKDVRPMSADRPIWDGYLHYSFKNKMPLTDVYEPFQRNVHDSPVTGNWDEVEGGFDGVMQALVCTEKINWRPDARHLLVYVSDERPHIAGDGKLAGLPQPNDEKCHLNSTGHYSHAELQDFPSLGQINWQARKNNINIIFATIQRHKQMYDAVQKVVQGSSVGIFDRTSDNVIRLISAQYEKLVRSLKMTSNSTSNFLDIKFFSRCKAKNGILTQTEKCDGIRVHDTIEFDVVIKATDCPQDEKDWRQVIEIKPEGIPEGVIVKVELICDCECSKKIDKGPSAPRTEACNKNGILECGVCSCDQGYYGKSCQCEGTKGLDSTDESGCRVDNSSKICSGHGSCICGGCSCDRLRQSEEYFYGKFCQCDDLSCKYSHNGKICGGNGRCECGKCMCDSGWGGAACDCRDDISLCLPAVENAKVCNDAGDCVCGKCKCDPKKGREGRFCEDCPSCPSQRCDEFKDCVECLVHKSGRLYAEDENCLQCSDKITPVVVDEVEEDPDKIKPGEHVCRIAGDDGSTFVFTYSYVVDGNNKGITIVAEKEKEFRVIDDFVAATLGVVFLTLLLGFLILLIWKILTLMHDRREFAKFKKESSQANWGQGDNPLYKEAVTTVKNPMFESGPSNNDL